MKDFEKFISENIIPPIGIASFLTMVIYVFVVIWCDDSYLMTALKILVSSSLVFLLCYFTDKAIIKRMNDEKD